MNNDYKFPPIELLKKSNININQEELEESKKIIENTLASFEAPVEVTDMVPGNIVTRYYLKPENRNGNYRRKRSNSIRYYK